MNYDHNYYEKGLAKFFKDGAECFWHSWIKRRILVVDIIAEHSNVQNKDYYRRVEYWTDTPAAVLHENGYRICEGLHDNLAWIGVPIMMKLYNFKTINKFIGGMVQRSLGINMQFSAKRSNGK